MQILNVRFWQSLNVRFFEAAEQHAEAGATRPWAKPVGCKQPTGTATALTRRGAAAARKRCPADAYTIARSLGGTLPPEPPEVFLRHDVAPMEGVTGAAGTGRRPPGEPDT